MASKRLQIALLAAGLLIILFLLLRVGIEKVASAIAATDKVLVAASSALIFAIFIGKSIRYGIIASRIKCDFWEAVKIATAGQLFNQINIAASEFSKTLLLKKRFGLTLGQAAAPSVVERSTDILALTSFAAVGAIFYFNAPLLVFAVPVLLLAALAAFLKVPFFRRVARDFMDSSKRIGARTTLVAIAISVSLWLTETFAFILLLNALGAYPPFMESLAAYALSFMVSTSIFMTIGGLEASFVLFFSMLGVQVGTVLAAAIIYRFVILAFVGPFGIISLKKLGV